MTIQSLGFPDFTTEQNYLQKILEENHLQNLEGQNEVFLAVALKARKTDKGATQGKAHVSLHLRIIWSYLQGT